MPTSITAGKKPVRFLKGVCAPTDQEAQQEVGQRLGVVMGGCHCSRQLLGISALRHAVYGI